MRRFEQLERKPATRIPKVKFVVFCEGKNTEPRYFEEVAKLFRGIILIIAKTRGVPMTLAEAASAVQGGRADGK